MLMVMFLQLSKNWNFQCLLLIFIFFVNPFLIRQLAKKLLKSFNGKIYLLRRAFNAWNLHCNDVIFFCRLNRFFIFQSCKKYQP